MIFLHIPNIFKYDKQNKWKFLSESKTLLTQQAYRVIFFQYCLVKDGKFTPDFPPLYLHEFRDVWATLSFLKAFWNVGNISQYILVLSTFSHSCDILATIFWSSTITLAVGQIRFKLIRRLTIRSSLEATIFYKVNIIKYKYKYLLLINTFLNLRFIFSSCIGIGIGSFVSAK